MWCQTLHVSALLLCWKRWPIASSKHKGIGRVIRKSRERVATALLVSRVYKLQFGKTRVNRTAFLTLLCKGPYILQRNCVALPNTTHSRDGAALRCRMKVKFIYLEIRWCCSVFWQRCYRYIGTITQLQCI